MKFEMVHNNINVSDIERSVAFYKEAFDLYEARRVIDDNNEFIIVLMQSECSNFQLELTWLRDMDRPYNLGDNEWHLAFATDNYEAAFKKHKDMDCICFINEKMGVYFIEDPDGYWMEVKRAE